MRRGVSEARGTFLAFLVEFSIPLLLGVVCALVGANLFHEPYEHLLLWASADDAIGLVIIGIFYGEPAVPVRPAFLGRVGVAMAIAFALRKFGVQEWWVYIGLAGPGEDGRALLGPRWLRRDRSRARALDEQGSFLEIVWVELVDIY